MQIVRLALTSCALNLEKVASRAELACTFAKPWPSLEALDL